MRVRAIIGNMKRRMVPTDDLEILGCAQASIDGESWDIPLISFMTDSKQVDGAQESENGRNLYFETFSPIFRDITSFYRGVLGMGTIDPRYAYVIKDIKLSEK